jgi:hypothetical protein
MHKILIGINRDLSGGVEKFLEDVNYEKHVEDEFAYFAFISEHADGDYASYLQLHAGDENHAFVRIGNQLNDIEHSGNMKKFNMYVERSAYVECDERV